MNPKRGLAASDPDAAVLTGKAMWAKRDDVPTVPTEVPISPMERALLAYARHAPISWGKYRLVNALWKRAAPDRRFREAKLIYGGFRVSCDIGEIIQRQLYFFGTYHLERGFIAVWRGFARDSHVIFDVGANAGIYSLAAISANPNAMVHAFEPTPEIADRLRQVKARNGLHDLTIVEAAVCDSAGQARLVRCNGGGDNGGMNFISQDAVADDVQVVEAITLDGYCRQQGIDHIDLMKVDVQGLEPDVFRGAHDLLSQGRIGRILVELNWGPPGEISSADDLIALLDRHGFHFSAIKTAPHWRRPGAWLRRHADIMASRIVDTPRAD